MKRLSCLMLTCVFLSMALAAQAVQVQTVAAPGQSRDAAIASALDKALMQESLRMLPGQLNDARQALLAGELARMRDLFIITYTETGTTPGPNGETLSLDVAVNAQGLERWLKNAGLFHTLSAELPYDLMLKAEATDEEIAELSRLQALSGVRPQNGSVPLVILEKPAETWHGRLVAGEARFLEQAPDLTTLWFALWSHYFSRQGPAMADVPPAAQPQQDMTTAVPGLDPVDPLDAEVPGPGGDAPDPSMAATDPLNMTTTPAYSPGQGDYLVVSGWYTTDGVLSFDRELASWDGVVGNAVLAEVNLGSSGHQGKWLINAADPGALTLKLTEYTASRGLTFRFVGQ